MSTTAESSQVSISWSSVSGATSYNIYWSTTTGVTKTTGTKLTGATSPYAHTGLTNGTTYYYVVTAVNSYGESVESSEVSATPTSGAAPDTTAPTVSAVSPGNGAIGVSISTTITATFSEAMNSSTITTSTFTISGVSGTVSYSGTTATFTPSGNLSYSTTYTATITTGVKDSAGNAMASSYSWSFTTTSNNANLSSLTISGGVLNPTFASGTTSYTAMFITQTGVTVTPTATESGAVITVNGSPVTSGQASGSISLSDGANTITIVVTAPDTVTTKTYTITANKLYQQAYVKASNTGAGDWFGYSVAISGDTLAVGAIYEASNATGINGNEADNSVFESGAVYVFK